MKKICVLCFLIVGLGACSSTEKKEMEAAKETMKKPVESTQTEMNKEKVTEEVKKAGSRVACTLEKDTRVIEVKNTDGGGCELFYTKFSEAKSVASSGFGTQYCEEVKDRIQSNLKKAGFACQ